MNAQLRPGQIQPWESTLGRSLRELRKENGFTLVELGKTAGLSPSFLSQLERGLTRASLHSLQVLAEALGASAATLLSRAHQTTAGSVSFVPAATAPEKSGSKGTGYVLVRGHQTIQPTLIVGGSREFGFEHVVHHGDEFIHVVSGRIQFELVGEGLFDLGHGDSLFYRGGVKHRWRQLGPRPCRFLSVLSEP